MSCGDERIETERQRAWRAYIAPAAMVRMTYMSVVARDLCL